MSADQPLTGKLALVTGGARNVGKAIASALVERGAHVIVNYFHSSDLARATEAELRVKGDVDLIRASVARPDQVARMFADIKQRYGRLDILVNNAASGALAPDDDVTDDDLDKGWNTNVKGALRCSRHAAELMRQRGSGAIVNVSALGGSQFVMAGYLACAPAKAAMEALTRYLAAQYAPDGIRVNTASAAMLVSAVADAFPQAAAMQDAIASATPLGRLGTAEEFADVVAFLAGDDARWITGQVLLADGGLSLGVPLLSPPARPSVTADEVPSAVTDTADNVASDGVGNGGSVAEAADTPVASAAADAREPADPEATVEAIAVVGMGMAVAGANSPEEFWDLRLTGADLFVPVPADRWDRDAFHSADENAEDKSYQDRCVFITGFRPADGIDDQVGDGERREFTTAWLRHSVAQAMGEVTTRTADRFRCVLGYTPDGNQHLEEAGVLAATTASADAILTDLDPACDEVRREVRATLADRYHRGAGEHVSRFLPHNVGRQAIEGVLPSATSVQMIDTACSSSLYAVDIGAKALLGGTADVVVCGGAFALGPRGTVLFSKLHGLSKRGDIRSLDQDADGVIFADGAAAVVLKRLSRAREDGDEVLAVLRGTGTSSDGKGKAVYAPNPDGQARAVARAPVVPVDWILAHATGTPAGDLAELTTLHQRYGGGEEVVPVTSNKSLIGHTGWAAGVVSLIEAVLGMRHGLIPPQFRFTAPPAHFPADRSRLTIPTEARPLPPVEGRPRTVAISGFGFGGTNAHLIVSEPTRDAAEPVATGVPRRRVAIVGWSAHLPGLPDRSSVEEWLRGSGRGPDAGFGNTYPAPAFQRVKLPRLTVQTIDRCQLMVLECAHQLRELLGDAWTEHADRTGVFVGHLGPTRAGMSYANRCYVDDSAEALTSNRKLAESEMLPKLLHGLREHALCDVPPSNEDSFPGIMPNVIPARVANYFGLHGPNLALDAGLASTLWAFDVATQYLRAGEIDLALAGGINGNTLPELRPLLADLLPDTDPAEGAFLFALAGADIAEACGLPVLGWVEDIGDGTGTGFGEVAGTDVECGTKAPETARYLGAAGGVEILRQLLTGHGRTRVVCHGERDTPPTRLGLTVSAPAVTRLEDRFTEDASYAPGTPCRVRRYVAELVAASGEPTREPTPFLPSGVVLLTDRPELVTQLGPLPADATVLCCGHETQRRTGWHHLADVTPAAVDAALAGRRPEHLRVLVDLSASAPPADCLHSATPVDAMHDLTFLALQRSPDASLITLLLGALPGGVPHPCTGLFTGLVKAAHLESPGCERFVLATDERSAAAGMRAAERESGVRRTLPVVFHHAGVRQVPALTARQVRLPHQATARFSAKSVVVAVGGARGITAELLKELARQFGPKVYVVARNPLDTYPDEVFAGDDTAFAARRKHWLREQLTRRRGTPVASLNREYDRMIDARAARRNIEEIAGCGAAQVRYLTCDVTDPAAVQRTMNEILAAEPAIDLLINAAGRNNSALLARKDFEQFRAVRDVKLRAHRNLKRALAGKPVHMWCNFGSLLGFFGQRGESDYAAANDYLATASQFAARTQGSDEFTIGWTLWSGAGMGSGDLVDDYYRRAGSYSNMAVAEGVHHFVRELHAVEREPNTVHVGDAEQRTVAEFYPGFFPRRHPADFYLRRERSRRDDSLVYECPMDPATDGYLRDHRVRGHATMPGLFVAELAAEAALRLRPDWCVVGFTDLRFHRFLRVREDVDGPPTRIHATVLDATADLTTVDVRITSDIVAPNGMLAMRDKPHFTCRVLLARQFTAMRWQPWEPDPTERAVPDPYHLSGSPVTLTGPFVCTTDTRLHPRGGRARFAPGLDPADPVWSRFTTPCLLLDGMARMGALHLVDEHLMPVAVPTSIRRIDLYQQANDATLTASGPVELYATPAEFTLDAATGNRFVAVGPDGHTLAQIKDVAGKVLGYVDSTSGRFHTEGEAHG